MWPPPPSVKELKDRGKKPSYLKYPVQPVAAALPEISDTAHGISLQRKAFIRGKATPQQGACRERLQSTRRTCKAQAWSLLSGLGPLRVFEGSSSLNLGLVSLNKEGKADRPIIWG